MRSISYPKLRKSDCESTYVETLANGLKKFHTSEEKKKEYSSLVMHTQCHQQKALKSVIAIAEIPDKEKL